MNDITFIIPNRGGTQIERVIDNFTKTFEKQFSKLYFIVITQDDDLTFKRGQLYNIAFKYIDTDFVSLIDNDIYNIDSFNIVAIYKKLGPYVAFNKISQLKFKSNEPNETKYDILKTEPRLSGFGAFNVFKKNDFIKCNGFSNLCFGWGCEDNILHERIKFTRFTHTLGHINHPRRVNDNPKSTEFNKKMLIKTKRKEIKKELDGLKDTICDIVEDKIENNIRYLKVNNIRVGENYHYTELYKRAKEEANEI